MSPRQAKKTEPAVDPLERLLTVTVLAGDDERGKDELLAAILAKLGKDADVLSYEGDGATRGEAEIGKLRRDLASRSLFGTRRVIVVRDGDGLAKRAGKALAALLDAPDAGNAIVLRFAHVDQRLAFFKRVKEQGGLLLRERPKADHLDIDPTRGVGGSELLGTIVADAKARGLDVDSSAALEIALRVGNDRLAIAAELEKLEAMLGGGKVVRRDHVLAVTPQSAMLEPFRLFQEVATGETAKALSRVRGILDRGIADRSGKRMTDPQSITIMLIATLHQRLALLARYRDAQARGLSRDQIQVEIGVKNPGQMYFLAREVVLPLVASADAAMGALLDADRGVKSGEPAGIVLTRLAARLASLARATRPGSSPPRGASAAASRFQR